jgi:hypothetical protein
MKYRVSANWIVAATMPNTSGLHPRGIGRSGSGCSGNETPGGRAVSGGGSAGLGGGAGNGGSDGDMAGNVAGGWRRREDVLASGDRAVTGGPAGRQPWTQARVSESFSAGTVFKSLGWLDFTSRPPTSDGRFSCQQV